MTFPSLRKLLFVAPVFVVVGIAAACGPYAPPTCPMTCPPGIQNTGVLYYQPVANPQGQVYYVPQHASVPGTKLSVVNGKLHLQGGDGSKMSCETFTILVNGVEPAEVSVADKLIRITSGKDVKDGDFLQATAQKVSRTGPEGATLVLEGNAKLVYVRKGKKIDVSTDLLSVNLSTGQVLSEMDAPKPVPPALPTAPSVGEAQPSTTPPTPAPVSPVAPRSLYESSPDCPPTQNVRFSSPLEPAPLAAPATPR